MTILCFEFFNFVELIQRMTGKQPDDANMTSDSPAFCVRFIIARPAELGRWFYVGIDLRAPP